MREIRKDVWWGVKWGVFGGCVFGVFAGGVLLLKGGLSDEAPIEWYQLLLLYPALGLTAGTVIGFLRPLVKTRPGAMVVGSIAGQPAALTFLSLTHGPISEWGALEWSLCALGGIMLGCMGGYIFWDQHNFDPDEFIRKYEPRSKRAKKRMK